ncbi:SHOCT domain-containing protein [Mucilaginibacter sp. UYCu711]|uniref:SHOCT domain-containing protein n=1 Tax=Mucilaginibacter sp. UYCu711 TaxID=3156339 RepID=UPI003D2304E0
MLWIFAVPYNIPGQRKPKNSSLDILQRRFASGAISKEEFEASRQVLLRDIV